MTRTVSSLASLQSAFDELTNRLNEAVLGRGDGALNLRIDESPNEKQALQEWAQYLIGLCAEFVDVYDEAFENLNLQNGSAFDFGRDWESAVRALADLGVQELRSDSRRVPTLLEIVDYAYSNFEATFALAQEYGPVQPSSVHPFSTVTTARSTKALLHCWLLEADRRQSKPVLERLKKDLTEYLGDSRVYFATANAIIAMADASETDIALVRQGYAYAKSALRRSPQTPGLHHLCALFDLHLGVREIRFEEEARLELFRRARDRSTEAIDLNPTYHRYWATRAEAQRLLRDRERAKRDLQSALDLLKFDPRHPVDSDEYKEREKEYQDLFYHIRRDEEFYTILDSTTEQQESLQSMLDEALKARETLDAKTTELEQNFKQLQLTVTRVETDASANRREQIQLVAIVAAFIGLIAATVPVVGAGVNRVEATGGAVLELLPLLLIPAVLIVVLIVALNMTFRRGATEETPRATRQGLSKQLIWRRR